MMKRTRVDEVQFGTRPGPPTAGGVGVGVVGVAGGGGPASGTGGTATVGVNTAGVTIGTVVPSAHNPNIGGISSIHHRILTPQHGGAQTIAYLPSTTPTATNLKTSSIVDSTTAGAGAVAGTQTVGAAGGAGGGGGSVVVSTGSTGTQTLQYTTCKPYDVLIPNNRV